MTCVRRLLVIAKNWQEMAGIGRRRISQPKISCNQPSRGHFVVYSVDKRRFVVPLAYLSTGVFRELFRLSEEEFGLPGDGPITLPLDAACLEHIVSIVERLSISQELDTQVIVALASVRH